MATIEETRQAKQNLDSYDDLLRKSAAIEAMTIGWMAQATQLYGDVTAADQATILALRSDLIAKLTTATAIP